MKEYCALTTTSLSESYVVYDFSRRQNPPAVSFPNSGLQLLLNEGWQVTASAIHTHVCSGEVKYRFILERDIPEGAK